MQDQRRPDGDRADPGPGGEDGTPVQPLPEPAEAAASVARHPPAGGHRGSSMDCQNAALTHDLRCDTLGFTRTRPALHHPLRFNPEANARRRDGGQPKLRRGDQRARAGARPARAARRRTRPRSCRSRPATSGSGFIEQLVTSRKMTTLERRRVRVAHLRLAAARPARRSTPTSCRSTSIDTKLMRDAARAAAAQARQPAVRSRSRTRPTRRRSTRSSSRPT